MVSKDPSATAFGAPPYRDRQKAAPIRRKGICSHPARKHPDSFRIAGRLALRRMHLRRLSRRCGGWPGWRRSHASSVRWPHFMHTPLPNDANSSVTLILSLHHGWRTPWVEAGGDCKRCWGDCPAAPSPQSATPTAPLPGGEGSQHDPDIALVLALAPLTSGEGEPRSRAPASLSVELSCTVIALPPCQREPPDAV